MGKWEIEEWITEDGEVTDFFLLSSCGRDFVFSISEDMCIDAGINRTILSKQLLNFLNKTDKR